jgi:hypothetical protein
VAAGQIARMRSSNVTTSVPAAKLIHLIPKFSQFLTEKFPNSFRQGVGHSLQQEFLLPFENEFLIAQRIQGQPTKHRAGQKNR